MTGYVINATVTRDPEGHQLLPRFTGPFVSRVEAEAFMNDQLPLYGSWTIRELTAPEDWPAP